MNITYAEYSAIISNLRILKRNEKLQEVKRTLEWIDYIKDEEGRDYWQTPAETFIRGSGDCEDIAIASLYMLLAVGVLEEELLLVLGTSLAEGKPTGHMVVMHEDPHHDIYPLVVLDNTVEGVKPVQELPGFTPLIGFNSRSTAIFYGHKDPWDRRPATFNIPKWSSVMDRYKRDWAKYATG